MKTPFLLPASVLALASLINLAAVPAQAHAAPARIAAAQHEHSEFDATLNAPYQHHRPLRKSAAHSGDARLGINPRGAWTQYV